MRPQEIPKDPPEQSHRPAADPVELQSVPGGPERSGSTVSFPAPRGDPRGSPGWFGVSFWGFPLEVPAGGSPRGTPLGSPVESPLGDPPWGIPQGPPLGIPQGTPQEDPSGGIPQGDRALTRCSSCVPMNAETGTWSVLDTGAPCHTRSRADGKSGGTVPSDGPTPADGIALEKDRPQTRPQIDSNPVKSTQIIVSTTG